MQYHIAIQWKNKGSDFTPKTYDRTHQIQFAGGLNIDASAAPEFAGNATLPNPEELFIASIASCFMLTFLYLAAMKDWQLISYKANAVGQLAKNAEGKMAVTDVVIKPELIFKGDQPDTASLKTLYDKAHDMCFISCSVKTRVNVELD